MHLSFLSFELLQQRLFTCVPLLGVRFSNRCLNKPNKRHARFIISWAYVHEVRTLASLSFPGEQDESFSSILSKFSFVFFHFSSIFLRFLPLAHPVRHWLHQCTKSGSQRLTFAFSNFGFLCGPKDLPGTSPGTQNLPEQKAMQCTLYNLKRPFNKPKLTLEA